VRRILVNSNLSRVRRHRVREVLTQLPPEQAAWAGSDPGDRLDLLQALLSLPRRQRAVVVLRYWADLPEVEVARIMCCSIGTVRSQAHRALAKLRVLPDLQSLAPKEGGARWASTKTVS
jgi:DNA-directed RNA polymerase specialized sigma24 family protein